MSAVCSPEPDIIDPEELRDAARRVLSDEVKRRAGWGETGAIDTTSLQANIVSLGWLLLTLPTARGGLGQNFLALSAIYEELGRVLAPVVIADTLAAVDALAWDSSDAAGALLDRIVAGEARVAIVFSAGNAEALSQRYSTVCGVLDATDLLVLPEQGGAPASLVDLRGAGVISERVETWDRSRSFGDIVLEGAATRALAISAVDAARIARAHLELALAWECVGGAQQALDEAIAYMGTRQQFGRPIGSFQALKHRAADLKVALELARALARHASEAYVARDAGWNDVAGQAKVLATDAFRAIAEESVQFHGGIGFTWEHDCHLFLKRALMNEMLYGTPEQVRDRVAPGVISRALMRGA